MTERQRQAGPLTGIVAGVPPWLRTAGVYGWLLAGALVLLGAMVWIIGFTSGLSVPLMVAAVLGALFAPLVDRLTRVRIPRGAGATIVLALLIGLVVLSVWLVVAGVISQGALIATQIDAGVATITKWAVSLELPADVVERLVQQLSSALDAIGQSALSLVSSGLTGTVSLLFGAFLGSFMLYFILKDWDTVSGWLGAHIGVPAEMGRGLVEDAVGAMREYFETLTISAVIVAAIVGVGMWILGLPLVAAVTVVTFLTCYIPFLGAIVSGIFAVLIALGAGGVGDAAVILVVILIAQNLVQTVVLNHLASERLKIHPLGTLIATIFGGIAGGMLGAALGPALLAFALKAIRRFQQARTELAYEAESASAAG